MKVNLMFEQINNTSNIKEQKQVPIDIPDMEEGEWNLVNSEIITNNEKISKKSHDPTNETCIYTIENQTKPTKHIVYVGSKLFRKDDKIQIAYIYEGQKIDFNTIFITPSEVNLFFAHIRKIYGGKTRESEITDKDAIYYNHWDNLMKERFMAFSNHELIFDSVQYTNIKTKHKTIIKNVQKDD